MINVSFQAESLAQLISEIEDFIEHYQLSIQRKKPGRKPIKHDIPEPKKASSPVKECATPSSAVPSPSCVGEEVPQAPKAFPTIEEARAAVEAIIKAKPGGEGYTIATQLLREYQAQKVSEIPDHNREKFISSCKAITG